MPHLIGGEVDLIVPTFNSARYLGETLDSLLGPTFHGGAFLVVDDGSADELCSFDQAREFRATCGAPATVALSGRAATPWPFPCTTGFFSPFAAGHGRSCAPPSPLWPD